LYFNTIHANTFQFYEEINAVIQEEPADSADPEILGQLAAIGIVKGKPFAPDARMKKILTNAVAVGNATARAISFQPRDEAFYFYPGKSAWFTPFVGGSHEFLRTTSVCSMREPASSTWPLASRPPCLKNDRGWVTICLCHARWGRQLPGWFERLPAASAAECPSEDVLVGHTL
jgi:hypothetical protein